MSDSLCVGCGRPPHDGPCYPEIVGPLHARIAALEAEVAALQSAAQSAPVTGDVRGRYTLREPVRAIQYDGVFGGARHLAIEVTLREAFGDTDGDWRAGVGTRVDGGNAMPVVCTSADGEDAFLRDLGADDYVVVHYVDGEAAAVSVLAEAVFDAMYVAVGSGG